MSSPSERTPHRLLAALVTILGLLICTIGVIGWQHPSQWQIAPPLQIGPFPLQFVSDKLSAIFLLILGTVSACCAMFSADYIAHAADKLNVKLYWICLVIFIGGMAGVILAGNAVTFIVAWEVMSLASVALVTSEFRQTRAQRAGVIYLVATRIATCLISAGFLLMFMKTGLWRFEAWHFDHSGSHVAAFLIILGLIMKAGVWPFHIWLPHAHPEAPSPVSALMSGVMVKVPIYAAVRLFVIGDLNCPAITYTLFTLGLISTFWGILFAIEQKEIKRLLAYSTVENIGLMVLAVSITLWSKSIFHADLTVLAMTALLLQCAGHACYKALLFLCAGSIDYSVKTRELADLGGLIAKMPVTCATFIIGGAAICALPPMIGFVSKWYLYNSLFQAILLLRAPVERGICLVAIGVLSCIGALVIACFAKAIGVGLLGRSRTHRAATALEVPRSMLIPQVLLASLTLIIGLGSPILVSLFQGVPVTRATTSEIATVLPDANITVALLLSMLCLLFYMLLSGGRVRRFGTWDCGFGALTARAQVAAGSFAQPIARIFRPVFRYHLSVEISGRDKRHFPEKIHVEPSMVSLLETRVYGPLGRSVQGLSGLLAKLQAGSIHVYLLYLCISLVLLILLGTQFW